MSRPGKRNPRNDLLHIGCRAHGLVTELRFSRGACGGAAFENRIQGSAAPQPSRTGGARTALSGKKPRNLDGESSSRKIRKGSNFQVVEPAPVQGAGIPTSKEEARQREASAPAFLKTRLHCRKLGDGQRKIPATSRAAQVPLPASEQRGEQPWEAAFREPPSRQLRRRGAPIHGGGFHDSLQVSQLGQGRSRIAEKL